MLFNYFSGQQWIDDNKHAGESLANLIAMQVRRYDTGRIAWWITSGASLEATGCSHRASACAVSPRRPPWSTNLLKQHKTLTKHNFYLATTYGTFWALVNSKNFIPQNKRRQKWWPKRHPSSTAGTHISRIDELLWWVVTSMIFVRW